MAHADTIIKKPNVSGQFYPGNPRELSAQIDSFLNSANDARMENNAEVIIVPHAGYVYSGPVAAYGFKAVSHAKYSTIIILAPSHYFSFDGISIGQQDGFATPLGIVEVDKEFARQLSQEDENFYFRPEVFEQEHSLEVEIPFLQKTQQNFKIVPVIMGQPVYETLEKFAVSLSKIIGTREDVLLVVSTDLSHYHPDVRARTMDVLTIQTISSLNAKVLWDGARQRSVIEMCGFVPAVAALLYAKQRGLTQVKMLRYANSGDVTGEGDNVVGYSSLIISRNFKQGTSNVNTLNAQQKKRLIEIAKTVVEEYVRTGKKSNYTEKDLRLLRIGGAFVTITRNGQLRGCIGNILGRATLYQTVADMAIAAATEDPRFDPIKPEELNGIDIEISVLSVPRVINNIDEIVLGQHGVIVSQGPFHQGVFLPQVAQELGWSKEEFLSQLCSQKAGLPRDAWKDPKTKIEIFTAQVFGEKDF